MVYAATAFAVLQAADIILPQMNVPDWAMGLLVTFVIFGFPIALVLGWALEVTPDGIKRTEAVPAGTSEAATPALLGKRTVFAAALLVVLGIGLGAGWLLKPAADGPEFPPVPVVATPVIDAIPASAAGPGAVAAESGDSDQNTIAVLPFVNMSANPDNVFFAEGMAEELLNILAGVDGLRVASRTSAFSFKDTDTPIPQIARELGVRHILEGSVRRQADRVRITAQLIETRSDTQLWSGNFERDLVDIFRVQEEIAQAITLALKDVLGVRTISVAAATPDLEAYERFLRGRARFYQRANLDEAIDDLRAAVERDPGFAEAWAFLGAASFVVANGGYATAWERAELWEKARQASERALALDPGFSTALAVKGQVLLASGQGAADRAEGIRLLERAAAQASPDSSARLWLGLSLMELGLAERALPFLEQAYEQDPLVPINVGYIGVNNVIRGQMEAGQQFAQRAVDLGGHAYWSILLLIELANLGDEAATAALLDIIEPQVRRETRAMIGELRNMRADPVRHQAYLESLRLREEDSDDRFTALLAALILGDSELAVWATVDGLSRLYLTLSAWMPSLGWLRDSPEFYEHMHRIGNVGYWEAEGFPPGCRPVDDPAGRRLDCSGYGR